jgi:cell division protein FtsW
MISWVAKEKTAPRTTVVRRHRPDYQIVLFMGILMLLGLVVIYSISPARVEFMNAGGDAALEQAHFMQRQFMYLFVGLTAFIVAAFMPFTFWKRHAANLLLAGLAANALLALLGLFLDGGIIIKAGGAVRWFDLGFISFQPAELLKFGILLFLAVFLGRRYADRTINSLDETILPVAVVTGLAVLFIIVFQKDMGTGITLLGMIAAMLFASGLNRKWMTVSMGALVGAGVLLIVTSPHRIARVLTFLSPSDVSDASSYHINQALIALGSGGFFGKGLGHGIQAFGYLPEAVNDSIFAILGETFGFVGVVLILFLFVVLLRRLVKTMERTLDPTQRLLVAGVFGLVATHIVVNIGAMTGIFPLTGVTLPFLSFGGTSLLFTMLELGIVFAISRYTTHKDITGKEASGENTERRRGVGRTRYAGSSRYQRTR